MKATSPTCTCSTISNIWKKKLNPRLVTSKTSLTYLNPNISNNIPNKTQSKEFQHI